MDARIGALPVGALTDGAKRVRLEAAMAKKKAGKTKSKATSKKGKKKKKK